MHLNRVRIIGGSWRGLHHLHDPVALERGDGDGLRPRLMWIHGPEIAVVEDDFGLATLYGKERRRAHDS
jgi:hypothetical protein